MFTGLPGSTPCNRSKWEVIQRQDYADSIVYTFDFKRKGTTMFQGYFCPLDAIATPPYTYYNNGIVTKTLRFSEYSYIGYTSSFPHSFSYPFLCECDYFGIDPYQYSSILVEASSDGLDNDKKEVLTKDSAVGGDTLDMDCWLTQRETWQKGLGQTALSIRGFESGTEYKLIGYIKNNTSYGNNYPDSWFTSISTPEESVFNLSPNPVEDKLVLSLNPNLQNYTVSVKDLTGRNCSPPIQSSHTYTHEISVSGWSCGIYIIQVQDEEGRIYTQKFVKE